MKRKADLTTLVDELKSESKKKYDIVVPSSKIKFVDGQLVVSGEDLDDEITKVLHWIFLKLLMATSLISLVSQKDTMI